MSNRKQIIERVILAVTILTWMLVFYPKPRVIGGLGGFYGPGKTAYREDYTCIGIQADVPPIPPCCDGGPTYHCLGIIINRVCTMETYHADDTITRIRWLARITASRMAPAQALYLSAGSVRWTGWPLFSAGWSCLNIYSSTMR